MDKHCGDCDSKGREAGSTVNWYFCMDKRTHNAARKYSLCHGGAYRNGTPSCMLVQSAYDGTCPYKQEGG